MPRLLTGVDCGAADRGREKKSVNTEAAPRIVSGALCVSSAFFVNQGSSAMIIGVRALEGREGAIKLLQQTGFIAGGGE